MKASFELPLTYRNRPLVVTIKKGGIEFHGKGAREKVLVDWLTVARHALGAGFVFPIEKGDRNGVGQE